MGSPRIKGDALRLTLDGVDYWADCTSVVFSQVDGSAWWSVLGQRTWQVDVTAIQSTAGDSLWRLLFEHGGINWVPYVYAPHGNTSPSEDEPHFTGSLILPEVTILGGEAGSTNEYVFTVTMPLDGKPQMLTIEP